MRPAAVDGDHDAVDAAIEFEAADLERARPEQGAIGGSGLIGVERAEGPGAAGKRSLPAASQVLTAKARAPRMPTVTAKLGVANLLGVMATPILRGMDAQCKHKNTMYLPPPAPAPKKEKVPWNPRDLT